MKTYYQTEINDEQILVEKQHHHSPLSIFLWGLFILMAGILIIGHSLGFISAFLFHIIISWQFLLIAIGLLQLFSFRNPFFGSLLIIIGGLFLLPKLLILPFSLMKFVFPIVILAVGFMIILRAIFGRNYKKVYRRIKVKNMY